MLMRSLLITLLVSFVTSLGTAAEPVTVIVGKDAAELEQFAARELAKQFGQLFDVEVTVANARPQAPTALILIGSPRTNPAVAAVAGEKWPALSNQGIVLRTIINNDKTALVVGGGSPQATLWAVYELGYQLGVRYLLSEDVFPDKQAFKLNEFDTVLEPELRTRAWRTINDFAIGPESWPLEDHKKLLGQLAKQKFNRVMLSVYPWQPFVHYEAGGIKKQTAMLWYGEKYPIARDAPGRTALRGATEFENPDFAGKNTYEEMTGAGVKLLGGVIDEAHRLGMSVGISISPLEFPREFADALPGAKDSIGLNKLVVAPGARQSFDDPVLKELVSAKIRAYLKTYPTVDALYLTLPEFPEWDEHVQKAWQALSEKLGDDRPKLDDLLQAAAERALVASGERGVRSLRGNIVALAFLDDLLKDASVLQRPDGERVDLVITSIDPELFPYLDRILPAEATTLNFVDYTARRVAENREYLLRVPADKVQSSLILTLADDNVGVLSQSTTRRLETLASEMIRLKWDGFSTRYWMLAELDPAVHYLSRVAWDVNVTARSAHDDLFTTITGKQSVSDRIWLALGHIETATELIDQHDLGFAFPVQGMFMKHYQAEPVPKWWEDVNESYTQAMIELYRSHDAAEPRSRRLLFYWAKRSEYVLEYLAAVKAVREAAVANQAGDEEKAMEQFETAIEQLYNAIDTLGDVARDQSDRGLIAVLNTYAYQPLLKEYEKMTDGE